MIGRQFPLYLLELCHSFEDEGIEKEMFMKELGSNCRVHVVALKQKLVSDNNTVLIFPKELFSCQQLIVD